MLLDEATLGSWSSAPSYISRSLSRVLGHAWDGFPGVRAVTFLTRRLLVSLASFGGEVPPAWDTLETLTGALSGA